MLTKETFLETFRDRKISGIIYFIRDKQGQTVCDKDGNPVKLNFDEARQLIDAGGDGLDAIIAARPGVYAKALPKQVDRGKVKRGK